MDVLINIILLTAIGTGVIYLCFQLIVLFREIRVFANKAPLKTDCPPVSVFKPLKGLDDDLEDNLKSFFELDYPKYELLFGLNDINDPAFEVVEKLRNRYPKVASRLIIDTRRIGLNPKINNLYNLYPYARFEHLVISDSNVRVKPDYLRHLIAAMESENTGLVTSAIRGTGARKLGAVLENLHLNSYIASGVFVAFRIFRIPISIGKSMLLRRKTLEEIGGFWKFRNVLAEDYMMSDAIRARNLQVRISPQAIDNINRNWSVSRFINRHTRWAQMRRHISIFYYLAEVLGNPVSMAFLYLLYRHNPAAIGLFVSISVLKIAVDFFLNRIMQSDLKWYHFLLSPMKDLAIGLIWFIPFFNNRINWRGNFLKINKQTYLVPILQEVVS